MFRALIALIALLEPVQAAHAVAWLHGRPDMAAELVSICHRESRCTRIGLHRNDADRDPSDGWRAQVRMGHLRAWCQPYTPDTWSTRGAWGLWAAAHWRYLPPCYQATWFDVPAVSAWVAARKWLARCDGQRRRGWCHTRPRAW